MGPLATIAACCAASVLQLTHAPGPGTGFVPEYSKVQAFNADGSRFLVRGTDGSTVLFDGRTLKRIGKLPIPVGDVEPRWRGSDRVMYLDGDRVREWSLRLRRARTLARFPGLGPLSSGAEQELGRAQRFYALKSPANVAFVADLETGTRGPLKRLRRAGDTLDYVAITPDSEHVMVMWARYGAELSTHAWKPVRRLTTWDEHADFCRTADGEDALVIAHYRAGPNDEVVELVPLDGGPGHVLWRAPRFNLALHISCRNTRQPGWAYLSSYWDGIGQRPAGGTAYENEVFALRLDSTPSRATIRELADTRMTERADYYDEPHATVRQDGGLVLFASNHGRHVADASFADVFAIDLR